MSAEEKKQVGDEWMRYADDRKQWADDYLAMQDKAEELRRIHSRITPDSSRAEIKAYEAHALDITALQDDLDSRKAEMDTRHHRLREWHSRVFGEAPGGDQS